jgi:hypothetical protein
MICLSQMTSSHCSNNLIFHRLPVINGWVCIPSQIGRFRAWSVLAAQAGWRIPNCATRSKTPSYIPTFYASFNRLLYLVKQHHHGAHSGALAQPGGPACESIQVSLREIVFYIEALTSSGPPGDKLRSMYRTNYPRLSDLRRPSSNLFLHGML